ncbi:FAD-binding oxidoreductase [Lebetimonas sp. JS032]|uniref:NAD(P)/FAD-dependent oxidoreductase n=1 Tax=Lebetimonas sp. JS032 TaxID=990070 RepID=UPI000467363B|nr:FAD-dependent oxidoreductase [Lebetimonas sp. JS032]
MKKVFDFVVIGAGIAGVLSAYRLKEYNTLLIDKKGILEGASSAAGAFLFPKIGIDSPYTRFINDSIIEAIEFYKKEGINTHTKGVLLLPRDRKDIEKFKTYEKEIKLPFRKIDNGFFFDIGSLVEVDDVKKKINVNFKQFEAKKIEFRNSVWVINDAIKTKNIILSTGYENLIDIPYIKIRPVWGERIELNGKCKMDNGKLNIYYHKNCSLAFVNGKFRIGATHKRNCLECKENLEEANELIKKANEIMEIEGETVSIKGSQRAASIDYFPVVGKIIDVNKTLLNDKHIVKGSLPKEIFYKKGLYIVNGMGGRGFSNAVSTSRILKEIIFENKESFLDTKRLFVKWARKEEERYLNSEW